MLARTWFGLDFSFKVLAGQQWHIITCRIPVFVNPRKQPAYRIALLGITVIMGLFLKQVVKSKFLAVGLLQCQPYHLLGFVFFAALQNELGTMPGGDGK